MGALCTTACKTAPLQVSSAGRAGKAKIRRPPGILCRFPCATHTRVIVTGPIVVAVQRPEVVPPHGPDARGAARGRPRDRRRRDARHRRPLGRRQVDAAALHRDARRPDARLDPPGGRGDHGAAGLRASPSCATGPSGSSSSSTTCCPSSTRVENVMMPGLVQGRSKRELETHARARCSKRWG